MKKDDGSQKLDRILEALLLIQRNLEDANRRLQLLEAGMTSLLNKSAGGAMS